MAKPTVANLRKHPKAVLILTFLKERPDQIASWDFEWFDTDEALAMYTDEDYDNWAKEDLTLHGDLHYFVLAIGDTSTEPSDWVNNERVSFYPENGEWATPFLTNLEADPSILVVPEPKVRKKAAPAAKKPAKKVVKGRKPGKAAAIAKGLPHIRESDLNDPELIEDVAAELLAAGREDAAILAAAPAKKAAPKKAAVKAAPKPGPKKRDREAIKAGIEQRAAARRKPMPKKAEAVDEKAAKRDAAVQAFMGLGK